MGMVWDVPVVAISYGKRDQSACNLWGRPMSEALTVKARLKALEQKVTELEKEVRLLMTPAEPPPTHAPLSELPEPE
jgi:hypothetical protein